MDYTIPTLQHDSVYFLLVMLFDDSDGPTNLFEFPKNSRFYSLVEQSMQLRYQRNKHKTKLYGTPQSLEDFYNCCSVADDTSVLLQSGTPEHLYDLAEEINEYLVESTNDYNWALPQSEGIELVVEFYWP